MIDLARPLAAAQATAEPLLVHFLNDWLTKLGMGENSVWRPIIIIVLTVAVGFLIVRISKRVVDRIFRRLMADGVIDPRERRIQTLTVLAQSIVRYGVDFAVILVVLSQLGVEPSVLVAGTSVLGVALGFGAQNLIKDVIAGFFIVMENQYLVGEHITSGTFEGVVEEIGLRITKVRAFSGVVHIIPNGQVTAVTNHSRGDMRVLVDVSVNFEENLERAESVLRDCCERFKEEQAEVLVEGPVVLGVQQLSNSEAVLRLFAKTLNGAQWQAERDLRKAAVRALIEAGITAPYVRQVHVPYDVIKKKNDAAQ